MSDVPVVLRRPMCRHCHRHVAQHGRRGLCTSCFNSPVRQMYPQLRPVPPADAPRCRHCGVNARCRPKGLCSRCSGSPGVRDLYPSTSKFCRRGVSNGVRFNPPLPAPTHYPPGTPGKVAELEMRAEFGLALWHPADATFATVANAA